MSGLSGVVIEYAYEGADSYRVAFGDGTATWTALSGAHAGSCRQEQADMAEVARDVWFVSWLEPTEELVSLAINLGTDRIYASYYYDGKRYFWQGAVTSVTRPAETR